MGGGPQAWRSRGVVSAVAVAALLFLLPVVSALDGAGSIESRPSVVHTAAGTIITLSVGASSAPFSFSPNDISNIAPGSNVTIDITNLGSTPHTFTLSSLVNYSLPSAGNTNLTSTFLVSHPPFYSISIPGTPGTDVATATFTAPTTIGSYQFFCTEPGHFASGMQGFLGVGETVGPPAPSPGIGLPVFIIAGVIVALVIMAIVLGFVVGRREGSKHEMPPERLGYPEMPAESPPVKPLQ